jgi:hypothetical protein
MSVYYFLKRLCLVTVTNMQGIYQQHEVDLKHILTNVLAKLKYISVLEFIPINQFHKVLETTHGSTNIWQDLCLRVKLSE